jgi:hypothetical protein
MQQDTKPFGTSGGNPMGDRSINLIKGTLDASTISSRIQKCGLCSTLQQRREIKTVNIAVKITTKPEHPINRNLNNKKAYDQYGVKPSPTTFFFVTAKETCSMLQVDLKDDDHMLQLEYTLWITNMEVNIDTTMLALTEGSSTLRIRAKLEETLNANYLEYTQIYTDGSKIEERPQLK